MQVNRARHRLAASLCPQAMHSLDESFGSTFHTLRAASSAFDADPVGQAGQCGILQAPVQPLLLCDSFPGGPLVPLADVVMLTSGRSSRRSRRSGPRSRWRSGGPSSRSADGPCVGLGHGLVDPLPLAGRTCHVCSRWRCSSAIWTRACLRNGGQLSSVPSGRAAVTQMPRSTPPMSHASREWASGPPRGNRCRPSRRLTWCG